MNIHYSGPSCGRDGPNDVEANSCEEPIFYAMIFFVPPEQFLHSLIMLRI